MTLINFNWQPADRQLRQFGVICLAALPAVGWFWGGNAPVVAGLAAAGLVLAAAGVAAPKLLKPLFLGATLVATPVGMVVGELAMLIIYFGVFLPIGLALRAGRRDALQLRLNRGGKTYWQAKRQPTHVASYYRQS